MKFRALNIFKKPLEKIRYKKGEKSFASSKRDELEKLAEPCKEFFYRTRQPLRFTCFDSSPEEVVDFAKYFINSTILDPALNEKFLKNLNGFVLKGEDINGMDGACGVDIQDDEFVIDKWVNIGEFKDDNYHIITEMDRIKNLLHEDSHAVSQKHDLDGFIKKLGIDKNLIETNPEEAIYQYSKSVKDHSIGEIESKFIEKLFRWFLGSKSEQIVADGMSMGLSANDLEQESFNLQQIEQSQFLANVDFVKRPKYDKSVSKSFIFRYIVGEVVSRILFEEYLKNPEIAIQRYSEFLNTNAQIDIDESMRILSGGRIKNYPEAMNEYIKIYNQKLLEIKFSHQSIENQEQKS